MGNSRAALGAQARRTMGVACQQRKSCGRDSLANRVNAAGDPWPQCRPVPGRVRDFAAAHLILASATRKSGQNISHRQPPKWRPSAREPRKSARQMKRAPPIKYHTATSPGNAFQIPNQIRPLPGIHVPQDEGGDAEAVGADAVEFDGALAAGREMAFGDEEVSRILFENPAVLAVCEEEA